MTPGRRRDGIALARARNGPGEPGSVARDEADRAPVGGNAAGSAHGDDHGHPREEVKSRKNLPIRRQNGPGGARPQASDARTRLILPRWPARQRLRPRRQRPPIGRTAARPAVDRANGVRRSGPCCPSVSSPPRNGGNRAHRASDDRGVASDRRGRRGGLRRKQRGVSAIPVRWTGPLRSAARLCLRQPHQPCVCLGSRRPRRRIAQL